MSYNICPECVTNNISVDGCKMCYSCCIAQDIAEVPALCFQKRGPCCCDVALIDERVLNEQGVPFSAVAGEVRDER